MFLVVAVVLVLNSESERPEEARTAHVFRVLPSYRLQHSTLEQQTAQLQRQFCILRLRDTPESNPCAAPRRHSNLDPVTLDVGTTNTAANVSMPVDCFFAAPVSYE